MKNLETKFSAFLISEGITPNIKGYTYLLEALQKVYADRTYLEGRITTALYPEIARKCNTTPSKVERAIRFAISKTKEFKPNSEYIALAVERERLGA